jgi:hypothetical protein
VLRNPEPYRPTRDGVRAVFNTERTLIAYEDLMKRLVYVRQSAEQPASIHDRR